MDGCHAATLSLALITFGALVACGSPESEQRATSPKSQALPAAIPSPEPQARNLILITLDTTRADALGSYGQALPVTPNIDKLAAKGVLFEQVSSSNPETLPSHASIMTGKFPFSHGVRSNAGYSLSESHETLADHLKAQGYRTGAEIATVVLARGTQITQGFDHYRGADSPGVKLKQVIYTGNADQKIDLPMRVASDISRRGIEFIRSNQKQKFFLWLHFFDAHYPYAPRADFRDKAPASPYHGEVAWVDFEIGRIMAELDRLGLDTRTLIAITADHGEGLGDHGEATHPYFVYESTIRVPLVLAGLDRVPAKRRVASHVRTIDIAPTLVDLLGLPPLGAIQGETLTPLIDGKTSDLELTGYGESSEFNLTFGLPLLRFVRDGNWKYIHKVNPELYDIANDPGELRNVAAQQPEIVDRLRAQLDTILASGSAAPDDSNRALDPATAKQLAALGYAALSPSAASREALDSTGLFGMDPAKKLSDIALLTNSTSMIDAGNFASAQKMLERILEHDPNNTYVLGLLSDALTGEGNNLESLAVLSRVYESNPSQTIYANNYAYLLATIEDDNARDGARALEIVQAITTPGGETDASILDTLAAALAETGDFEAAIRAESQAIDLIRADANQKALLALLSKHRRVLETNRPLREPVARSD